MQKKDPFAARREGRRKAQQSTRETHIRDTQGEQQKTAVSVGVTPVISAADRGDHRKEY